TAAREPGSRSAAEASSATPENRRTKPLREAPTATGKPSVRKAARWRRSARFPSGLLPKPSPGSTAIFSGETPAVRATAAAAVGGRGGLGVRNWGGPGGGGDRRPACA